MPTTIKYNTMLELGCGAGELLDYAKSKNIWKRIIGIELGRDFVLFTKSRGHEVYYIDISSSQVIPELEEKCDLIICNEVMEHVTNPLGFMHGAKKYLSPNGIFWCSFAIAEEIDIIRAGEWHYWTMTSLSMLCEQAGWQIISSERFNSKIDVFMRIPKIVPEYLKREQQAQFYLKEKGIL